MICGRNTDIIICRDSKGNTARNRETVSGAGKGKRRMAVYLDKVEDVSGLREALRELGGIESFEAYRFCDDFADERKRYSVYKIVHPGGTCVLKEYAREARYETEKNIITALPPELPVPRAIGFRKGYMLSEFIPGDDLKEPTDEGLIAAAKSVAEIMNAFPMGQEYDRSGCRAEIAYRAERGKCLPDGSPVKTAHDLFLERMESMPLTLANGDFVPINCIYNGEKVYIIDWEYGGILPYALDIARFLAHAGEGEAFSYRMTGEQKQLFIDSLYDALEVKPDRAVFERDIRLSLLDEYVMVLRYFLEHPEEERGPVYQKYNEMAEKLAGELLLFAGEADPVETVIRMLKEMGFTDEMIEEIRKEDP